MFNILLNIENLNVIFPYASAFRAITVRAANMEHGEVFFSMLDFFCYI